MAPQTRTQRQAAAKKAAATRKRNSARQSSGTAKASVRRTTTSAQSTGRAARTASKQAGRATARRVLAEKTRFEAVAREAERVVLIPVGAALEARDRVAATIRTYSDSRLARQQLNRFERRAQPSCGESAAQSSARPRTEEGGGGGVGGVFSEKPRAALLQFPVNPPLIASDS